MNNPKKQNSNSTSEIRLKASLALIRNSSLRYKKVDQLTAETYLNFIFMHDQVLSYLDKITRSHGITRSGINVLTILRSSDGNGCNQQKLSRLLLVSRANVTGLVDGLIRKGLVTRFADDKDRRACVVKISNAGEKMLDSILPEYHEHISRIFSGLCNTEKKSFNNIMSKIRITMDKIEKKSAG